MALSGTVGLDAGSNLIGQVVASPETSTIFDGSTALTPTKASFAVSASGATTIVAATAGKKIRVLQWEFTVAAAVNVNLQSHTTTTTTSGVKYAAANGGGVYSFSPVGWFDTVAGEALDINLSAAVNVGGSIIYVLV